MELGMGLALNWRLSSTSSVLGGTGRVSRKLVCKLNGTGVVKFRGTSCRIFSSRLELLRDAGSGKGFARNCLRHSSSSISSLDLVSVVEMVVRRFNEVDR